MSSSGTSVCGPCTFELGAGEAGSRTPRKQSIRIDDLIVSHGGFDTPAKTWFGVVVVGGSDPDGVTLQGFVVNSHTSAFDASVFGYSPQELVAARLAPTNSPPEFPENIRSSPRA